MPVVIPNFRYAMIPSKGPTFISIASTLEVPDRKASAKNPSIEPSVPSYGFNSIRDERVHRSSQWKLNYLFNGLAEGQT